LQTFPDDFEFLGTKENVRKQIGMAVPVNGAKVVFEALFKTMKGIKDPSVESNRQKFVDQAGGE
jgi:DNA (cytosine-5)-methyltransferase 1